MATIKRDETVGRRWRVQETALVVLACAAVVTLAKWASDFIVPVVAGMMLAYALQPLVARLERLRLPRVIASTLVLALIVGALGGTIYALRHDAAAALAELPEAARKLRESVRRTDKPSALEHVQKAAAELDQAAAEATGGRIPPKPAPPAPVSSELQRQIAAHGATLLEIGGQLVIAITLALFLLTAGDTFRRKLVHIVGPSLGKRRVTVEILDEIDVQVQRYLLVMLVTNLCVASASWAAYAYLGLERAALWGAIAGLLHFIPYVGTVLAALVSVVAALLQEPSLTLAASVAGITFLIALVFGIGLNTWLQGHASKMNPVAVFVAVLFFGWLWGGWGLLLGAPLAAVAKTVADRVEGLKPFGELLGGQSERPSSAAAPESDAST